MVAETNILVFVGPTFVAVVFKTILVTVDVSKVVEFVPPPDELPPGSDVLSAPHAVNNDNVAARAAVRINVFFISLSLFDITKHTFVGGGQY